MPGMSFCAGRAMIDPYRLLRMAGLSFGMRFAEFGCGGTGHFVLPASRIVGEQGRVFAVDPRHQALRVLEGTLREFDRKNIVPVFVQVAQPPRLMLPDGPLDVLLLSHPRRWWHEEDVFSEAIRLLGTQGILVVVDGKPTGSLQTVFPRRFHPQEVRTCATRFGLDVQDHFEAGPSHFAMVLRKSSPSVSL
jgi:ubiquinone/menaquinone biosynthesis C-methylase UbiE